MAGYFCFDGVVLVGCTPGAVYRGGVETAHVVGPAADTSARSRHLNVGTAHLRQPNREVERPDDHAGQAPRAHTVPKRPRRRTICRSRPAPTLVSSHTAYLQPSYTLKCPYASQH